MSSSDLKSLSDRIESLENRFRQLPPVTPHHPSHHPLPVEVARVQSFLERRNCFSPIFRWVPSDYYDWPLSKRCDCLRARGTSSLYKSMLLVNRNWVSSPLPRHPSSAPPPPVFNPRFVLLVLPYDAAIDPSRLSSHCRGRLSATDRQALSKGYYDFAVASLADNERITGFGKGAVAPFGGHFQEGEGGGVDDDVALLLSKCTLDRGTTFIWVGGGHVDLKVGIDVKEMIEKVGAVVADVTVDREGKDDEE